MNGTPPEPAGWTRGRFLCVVGILFALQAGLILLFAEREQNASHLIQASDHLRLVGVPLTADQLAKTFFAIDPTVFPLPGLRGFSERAWLQWSAQEFEAPSETEEPAWLAIDAARLGTNFPQLNQAQSALGFSLVEQHGQELEPWPVFLSPEIVKTQSVYVIRGELAGRQLNSSAQLPSSPSAQLLSNSVVQIAVDSAGQVVAARLLARSGSAEADNSALDKARDLRFRPVPLSRPVWGNAVFEWQTVEPTNANPAAGP